MPDVTKKIAVVGNGYVGTGMLSMFRRCPGFDVVGYDVKNGGSRDDAQGADLAVVCVPTPMRPDGSADVSAVRDVCGWVDAPLVVIKSTVPPGTVDALNAAEPRWGRFHFSPEYMGEPTSYVPAQYPDPRAPWKHDFCVVGGPRAHDVLRYFARVMATSARYVACDAREAELCKYMENSYFATKVTFCNEWSRIAEKFGVDYLRLRDLWLLDSRVDPDHTMVFPDAPGFGGKCLPKDVNAIVHASSAAGHTPALLEAVLTVNERLRREENQS